MMPSSHWPGYDLLNLSRVKVQKSRATWLDDSLDISFFLTDGEMYAKMLASVVQEGKLL